MMRINQVSTMFNSTCILIVILVTVCRFINGNGEILMTGDDTVYTYPHFGDECISDCGSNGYCNTMKGDYRKCSAKIGYTWNHKKCEGACIPNKSYYYCRTSDGSWDYCSLHMKRPSVFHMASDGNPCVSSCNNFGKTYSWCSIGKNMNKRFCSKYDDTSYRGHICTSPCYKVLRNRFDNNYYCRRADNVEFCGIVQHRSRTVELQVLPREGGEYNATLVNDVDSGDDSNPEYVKFRFQKDDVCNHSRIHYPPLINHNCPWPLREQTLDDVFDTYFGQADAGTNNMHVETGHWSEKNPVDTVFRRVFDNVNILTRTEGIIAMIFRNHTRQSDHVDFDTSVINYLRKNLNATSEDDAGHLVAASLGGPPEFYNVVPQHRIVKRHFGERNRSRQWTNDWVSVEQRMGQFFADGEPGHDGGHIQFRVAIYYPSSNTGRPDMFQYLATFYDRNGMEINNMLWYPLPGVRKNQ